MRFALSRTYALCRAIFGPPTWWTDGAMCYKGLCVIRSYEGSTVFYTRIRHPSLKLETMA
jgi:hypothetical protein